MDTIKLTDEQIMDDIMDDGRDRARFPGWLRSLVIGRNPRRTLLRIIIFITCCAPILVTFGLILLPVKVRGPSMLPTYPEGGINFVNRLAYLHSDPKRGDVVAIRPSNPSFLPPSIMYMKRVVGLPGETLEFHEGHLYVNGKVLPEPYIKKRWDWESIPVTLLPGQFYVVGDNRSMPELYHEEGRVWRNHIVGKVVLCKNLFGPSAP